MKTGLKILSIFILGLTLTVSCKEEASLRDRAAIDYITDHFNHSHYQEHLTVLDVEIFDEVVIYESVYDMEVHTLHMNVTVDIHESHVVSNIKYGNFLEINRGWSKEMQRRIDEAESEEEINEIRETYLRYTYEKGVQTIFVALQLTWNEKENRWLVLGMSL